MRKGVILFKAFANIGIISVLLSIMRNATTKINMDLALMQMQNSNYIPNFTQSTGFVNLVGVGLIILFTCIIWQNEIRKLKNK